MAPRATGPPPTPHARAHITTTEGIENLHADCGARRGPTLRFHVVLSNRRLQDGGADVALANEHSPRTTTNPPESTIADAILGLERRCEGRRR